MTSKEALDILNYECIRSNGTDDEFSNELNLIKKDLKVLELLRKYASKGDRVELVGRWQVRNYVDKNGYDRIANEVVVENISLVTPKKKEEQSQEDKSVDDLPF